MAVIGWNKKQQIPFADGHKVGNTIDGSYG